MLTLTPRHKVLWGWEEAHPEGASLQAQPGHLEDAKARSCSLGVAVRDGGAWGGPSGGAPYILFSVPWCCWHSGQEVIVQQAGHPGDPVPGA